MPCRDDGPTPPLNYVSNELKDALNNATRAACAAMTALDFWESHQSDDVIMVAVDCGYITIEDQNHANKWWHDHQAADKDRKQALIESAKAKLTPEEREALCLK